MSNFNQVGEEDLKIHLIKTRADVFTLTAMLEIANAMRETVNISKLNLVEDYASENDLIDSEQALSDLFDEHIAQAVVNAHGPDDQVAINEAFNNWSDGMCQKGEIHEEQYNSYCYVGEYSKNQ